MAQNDVKPTEKRNTFTVWGKDVNSSINLAQQTWE